MAIESAEGEVSGGNGRWGQSDHSLTAAGARGRHIALLAAGQGVALREG